jgi:hypothetical protein
MKKKCRCIALGFVVLAGVGFFELPMSATAAPTLAAQTAPPSVRSGRFEKYRFTYEEQNGFGSFFYEPSLPADDAVVLRAIRSLLTTAYKVNLRNAPEPKIVGKFMRFITGEGILICSLRKTHNFGC